MSLLIEAVRAGRPVGRETRATSTHCRSGHELVGRNILAICRPCFNIRSTESVRRLRAKKAGRPITDPFPVIVCTHDITDPANQVVKCRECKRIADLANYTRGVVLRQAQQQKQSAK